MNLNSDIIYDLIEYIDEKELIEKYIYVYANNNGVLEKIYNLTKNYINKKCLFKYDKSLNFRNMFFKDFYLNKWIKEDNNFYKIFLDNINDTDFLNIFGVRKVRDEYFWKYEYINFIKLYNLNLHCYLENRIEKILSREDCINKTILNKKNNNSKKKSFIFSIFDTIKYKKLDIFEHLIQKNTLSKNKIIHIIKLLKKLIINFQKNKFNINYNENNNNNLIYDNEYVQNIFDIIKKYNNINIDSYLNKKNKILEENNINQIIFKKLIIKDLELDKDKVKDLFDKIIINIENLNNNYKKLNIINNKKFYFLYKTLGIEKLKKIDNKIFTINKDIFINLLYISEQYEINLNIDERYELMKYLFFERNIKKDLENFNFINLNYTIYNKLKFIEIINNHDFLELLLNNFSEELKKINLKYMGNNYQTYNILNDFYKNTPNWEEEYKITNFYDFLFNLSIDSCLYKAFELFRKKNNFDKKIEYDYTLLFRIIYSFGKIKKEHIEFIVKNNIELNPYLMEYAAILGDLELVKVLKEYNCPYDIFVLYAACKNGKYNIFKWSIDNGLQFDKNCFILLNNNLEDIIKKYNYMCVVEYNIKNIKRTIIENKLMLEYIISNKNYNIDIKNLVKKLLDEYNRINFIEDKTNNKNNNNFGINGLFNNFFNY